MNNPTARTESRRADADQRVASRQRSRRPLTLGDLRSRSDGPRAKRHRHKRCRLNVVTGAWMCTRVLESLVARSRTESKATHWWVAAVDRHHGGARNRRAGTRRQAAVAGILGAQFGHLAPACTLPDVGCRDETKGRLRRRGGELSQPSAHDGRRMAESLGSGLLGPRRRELRPSRRVPDKITISTG